jgi:hypothetical protein
MQTRSTGVLAGGCAVLYCERQIFASNNIEYIYVDQLSKYFLLKYTSKSLGNTRVHSQQTGYLYIYLF